MLFLQQVRSMAWWILCLQILEAEAETDSTATTKMISSNKSEWGKNKDTSENVLKYEDAQPERILFCVENSLAYIRSQSCIMI